MAEQSTADASSTTEDIARLATVIFGSFALVAVGFSAVREEAERATLLSSAALIAVIIVMRALANALMPARPIRAITLLLFLLAGQPATLILATLIEGEVTYSTIGAVYSHHDASPRVALATFVLAAATTLGAILIAAVDSRRLDSPRTWLASVAEHDVTLLSRIGAFSFATNFAMMFVDAQPEAGGTGLYLLRVVGHALWPMSFFIGVALRRRTSGSKAQFAFLGLASLLLIIAGNRGTPLTAFVCAGLGYVLAAPMQRRRLLLLGAGGAAVLLVGLVAGDVLRNDGGRRTSDDAFRRIGELAAGQQKDVDSAAVRLSTLHRLLRNSSHTVVTRIPETIPHEPDGLGNMGSEFASTFLPQIVRRTDYIEGMRAAFLRELGYVINENTAVELACLGDAWYRAGYLGTFVVGLLLGICIQLAEAYAYRGTLFEQSLKLIVVLGSAQVMEARDIVFGTRKMVMACVIAGTILLAFRLARGRSLAPSSPTAPGLSTGA